MTSQAQKRAQARFDKKRTPMVGVRLSVAEMERLDALRRPGEGRGPALARLAGFVP